MALQLYAIVRADHPLPSSAQPSAPAQRSAPEQPAPAASALRTVRLDDLAAVVRDVDDEQRLTDSDAVDHLDVLNELVLGGPVLPLRFGTIAPDDDSVREEVLGSAEEQLRQRLAALADFVEVRLDLRFDEDEALRTVLAADPELRALAAGVRGPGTSMDDRIRVGETVAERLTHWRQAKAEELLPRVAALAERSTSLEPPEPRIERRAFLVRRERLADMDVAVREVGEAHQEIDIEYIGPLPAYSFLDEPQVTTQRESGSAWGW